MQARSARQAAQLAHEPRLPQRQGLRGAGVELPTPLDLHAEQDAAALRLLFRERRLAQLHRRAVSLASAKVHVQHGAHKAEVGAVHGVVVLVELLALKALRLLALVRVLVDVLKLQQSKGQAGRRRAQQPHRCDVVEDLEPLLWEAAAGIDMSVKGHGVSETVVSLVGVLVYGSEVAQAVRGVEHALPREAAPLHQVVDQRSEAKSGIERQPRKVQPHAPAEEEDQQEERLGVERAVRHVLQGLLRREEFRLLAALGLYKGNVAAGGKVNAEEAQDERQVQLKGDAWQWQRQKQQHARKVTQAEGHEVHKGGEERDAEGVRRDHKLQQPHKHEDRKVLRGRRRYPEHSVNHQQGEGDVRRTLRWRLCHDILLQGKDLRFVPLARLCGHEELARLAGGDEKHRQPVEDVLARQESPHELHVAARVVHQTGHLARYAASRRRC
mmetsp:Transcript_100141/g.266187  ORF Transcript_100141/g.266187 Transcript_100141/m.266187 type:complete len:441 (+) Transcript_100141:2-1324(+)